MGIFTRVTGTGIAIAILLVLPAGASAGKRLIVSANSTTMPAKYNAQTSCGRLHVDDTNEDGVVDYSLSWYAPKWKPTYTYTAARFEAGILVTDRPVPRVAMWATNGAGPADLKHLFLVDYLTGGYTTIMHPDTFQRTICAVGRTAIRPVTVATPLPAHRRAYRKSEQAKKYPLLGAFSTDLAAQMFAARKTYFDQRKAYFAAIAEQQRLDELAAIQAAIDAANAAACPPGTLIGGVPCNPVDM